MIGPPLFATIIATARACAVEARADRDWYFRLRALRVPEGAQSVIPGLASRLRGSQFLSIGRGAIAGVAWAIVLADWLAAAATLDAVTGFALGGI
jgi:hypothetical protein